MFEADEEALREHNTILSDNIFYYMKIKKVSTISKLSVLTGIEKHRLYALTAPRSSANVTSLTLIKLERFFGVEKGALLKDTNGQTKA
jgi:hypothetical protein